MRSSAKYCSSRDEGVLALRTPALTEGYLNLPRVTAEKWREGWYLTGDVMRRDAGGFFYFLGRADDIKEYALANGPAYAHPRFVVFRDALPLSGTHKIDRGALVAEAARVSRAAGRAR